MRPCCHHCHGTDGVRHEVAPGRDRCPECCERAEAMGATTPPPDPPAPPPTPRLALPAAPGTCAEPIRHGRHWLPCGAPLSASSADRCWVHLPTAKRARESVRAPSHPDAIGVSVTT